MSSRSKTRYGFQQASIRFLRQFWRTSKFLTLTFEENVTDRAEANRRFKVVEDWLSRREVVWLGVWERQHRGAWHVHLLISHRVQIQELRSFIVRRGWGRICNIRNTGSDVVGRGAQGRRYAWPKNPNDSDFAHCAKYLAKYLDKHDIENDGMLRKFSLVVGSRSVRCWSTAFAWADGGSRAWRFGLPLFYELAQDLGVSNPYGKRATWSNRSLILRLGYEEIARRIQDGEDSFFLDYWRWEHAPDVPF